MFDMTPDAFDVVPRSNDDDDDEHDHSDTAPDENRPLVTPPRRNQMQQPTINHGSSTTRRSSALDSPSFFNRKETPSGEVAASSSGCTPPTPNEPDEAMNNGDSQQLENSAEEIILSVLDHLEDDWDEYTYLDLVPIDVRVSLEETLFGWDHLLSSLFGHVFYCAGAFTLSFAALYYLFPAMVWTRRLIGIAASIAAFRMVRRRRRVWMRHAYGSQAYRQDNLRRIKDVREADTGWLSRIRKYRQRRKAARQLRKAETQFQRHHDRQLKRAQTAPHSFRNDLTPGSATKGRRKVRMSFRTDPVPVMESIQQDQIVFAHGPIQRMPYSHGGFFAAAPFLLANPHWISILRHLMPDVYVEISRRVAKAPMQKLIHWAENNPVVAAYGSAQELEYDGKISNFEWDVFLDPMLVRKVMLVLEQRAKFLSSMGVLVTKPMANIYLPSNVSEQEKGILRYYNKQLMQRSQELVDKMLIAHGNLTQLIIEQTGYLKHYNYSRVKRTRRTLGGGIYAKQWMAVYAESLKIGVTEEDWRNNSPETSPERDHHVMTMGPLEPAYTAMDTSMEDAVAIVQDIAKCNDPVGLVLDVKSRHVPKAVWACVVDTLRKAGLRVEAVGSFEGEDIRDISQYSLKPVTELLFFHSAGDLQAACHAGYIHQGDSVFFNAGSLLWNPSRSSRQMINDVFLSPFDSENAKLSYQILPFAKSYRQVDSSDGSTIEHYKAIYNLSIGMYVQEFAIDDAAASLLADHVNRNPRIFNLGLSWGGINGICIRGIRPDRFTSTDGFWNQRYIGIPWNPNLYPPNWADELRSLTRTTQETECEVDDSWDDTDETSIFFERRLKHFT